MTQASHDLPPVPPVDPVVDYHSPYDPVPPPPAEVRQDERTWGMVCHLATFAGFAIPFGHIIAPLIVWQVKKAESPFVDAAGKEAVNFNISVTIYALAAALLMLIVIGIVLLPAVIITAVVLAIIAGVKASNGELYRYPFIIRFIK